MIEVRPYRDGDLERIRTQAEQRVEQAMFVPGTADAGPSFAIESKGQLLMVAGLVEVYPHYASAWALFAAGLAGDYAAVARAIRRVLDAAHYRRIDTIVRNDWTRAHALVRLLGFQQEGINRSLGPNGEDFAIYARVKEGEI